MTLAKQLVNIENMDSQNYTYQTYNLIAKQYVDKYYVDLTDVPYINLLLKDIPKGAKVLDAGCGAGQFTAYIQKQGYDAMGIDMSDGMLAFARQKSPEAHFEKMDIMKLTFPQKSFSAILSAYSLIHIPESSVESTLKGLASVLVDNGRLLVIAQKGETDHLIDEPLQSGAKTFYNFFTSDRLKKHFESSGFNVIFQQEIATVNAYSMSDNIIYIMGQKQSTLQSTPVYNNPA